MNFFYKKKKSGILTLIIVASFQYFFIQDIYCNSEDGIGRFLQFCELAGILGTIVFGSLYIIQTRTDIQKGELECAQLKAQINSLQEELQKKQELLTNLTEDKDSMSKLNSIFEPPFFNECIDLVLLLTSFSLLCILIFLNTEYGKTKVSNYKKDREIIDNHWLNDKDLIYLTYFCRGLYVLGILGIFYSMSDIAGVSIYSLNSVSKNLYLYFF